MSSLPIEVLFGIYLGVLTGIVPAVVAGTLGFVFKYVTDVTIPGFGVVVLALAIAGINGGLLALNDETIRSSDRAVTLVTSIVVVLMLSLYAHAQGDKLGGSVPRRITLQTLRDRTLSTDVIELVGGRRRVRVSIRDELADLEGYPPLSAELRGRIASIDWTFPADLPIGEVESRLSDRLKSEFDLTDVHVSLDEDANATIAAAPPIGGLSKRVPTGWRAVSIDAIVPTGLVRGEHVRVRTGETTVEGRLLSASSGSTATEADGDRTAVTADGSDEQAVKPPVTAATSGGDGRVTVAAPRSAAKSLLEVERGDIVVKSRGTRREYELASIVRRGGRRFRRLTVGAESQLTGRTIGEAAIRANYGVVVFALRAGDKRWRVAPSGSATLDGGSDLYVVGTASDLDRFAEVLS
ncbi:MAG: cation:proton antiporter regulatory subunit [Halobacteriota archaeon]